MKKILIILNILIILPLIALAQPEREEHPLDKWLLDCLEGKNSTSDMLECMNQTYTKWNDELTHAYKSILPKLESKAKKALQASQKSWIQYRDIEFKFIETLYSKEGSVDKISIVSEKIEVIKQRALMLTEYLNTIDSEYK
ncbi:MAG: hypothetical protein QG635_96 [Bacteroidota bacterium]|nr:hypothetical protein [Bacteroidota bacterium]